MRFGAVGQRHLAFDAEAGAERAAALHDMHVGVIRGSGCQGAAVGGAPAWPRQAVIVAADLGIVLGARKVTRSNFAWFFRCAFRR